MFVTLRGEPYLLWRAVDEHGAELDILLQKRRDKATARRFFKRAMRSCPTPRKIVIDQLRSYSAAKAEILELASVKHVFVKAAARVNNRAENSHQPTRERERRMHGFSRPKTYAGISFVLRADPATFRAQAASAARFTVSQTACSKVR
jgi:putative transposase